MKPELPKGARFFVTHYRRFVRDDGTVFPDYMTKWDSQFVEDGLVPLATGGVTEAILVDENGKDLCSAMAVCNTKDHFNKRIGRDIATGRALKQLEKNVH